MMKNLLRHRHVRGLLLGSALLLLVLATGTVGYHHIGDGHATWVDSFYMTFITVATIGYSEVVDLSASPGGRLFTVAIAMVGIVTLSYLFSIFVALLIESDLDHALRRHRMQTRIARLQGHYIVCGLGRVGGNVARELLRTHRPFVVVERDRATLDAWRQEHADTPYVHADAAEDDALRAAGVERAAGVFAVTSDDSHNLVIALSVKLLQPASRVVARLHDVRNADKARRAGADEIVSPDFTGGLRIASAMIRPHVVNFMDQMLRSDEGLRMEEVVLPPGHARRRIGEVVPPSRDYILVAAHEAGHWVFNPAGDREVGPGVALVLMTNPQGRLRLQEHLGR